MELIRALLKIKCSLDESNTNCKRKLDAFERILVENPEISDADACQHLYGNKKKNTEFRVLKHRYEQKLQDELFIASGALKNVDNFSFRPIFAEKNNIVISSLYKNGFQREAIKLAEKNLIFCKENYITEAAIPLTRILLNYYGFVQPNIKLFEKTIQENKNLSEMYNAENIAIRYNSIISNWYVQKKGGFSLAQIVEVNTILEELKILKDSYVSWIIHFTYFSTANFYYMLKGKYALSLQVAKEGIESCNTLFINDKMMRYRCNINVGLSYFYLKQYCEASKEYKNALAIVPEGHRLWFEDALNYFTILLRGKFYNELYCLCKSRMEHKNLKKIPVLEEQWRIREAFIEFLIEAKVLCRTLVEKNNLDGFSIHKFLNSVIFYNKDKAGLNIQIMIIKILFLLLKRKYEQIDNLTETLNQYIYKYLNKKESKRSFFFIKLLIKMVEVSYHPYRVRAHTKTIYAKLKELNFIIDEKSNMVELLPYEELWQIILDLLERNLKEQH